MQVSDFFIVVPRAMIVLARLELEAKWPAIISKAVLLEIVPSPVKLDIEQGPEGLHLNGLPTEIGLALNLCLKIPTRILLRITEFRCRDFPKLFKKTKNYDWNQLLAPSLPEIKVSAKTSRLMHHKRIASTVEDALKKILGNTRAEGSVSPSQTLFVRFADDQCQFSLDTSGEPLYKRGSEKEVGKAPLRETLAAALYFKFVLCVKAKSGEATLLDPMAGSGTLLLEAQNFSKAQYRRSYGFLNSPKLSLCGDQILRFVGLELMKQPWILQGVGLEQDAETFLSLKKNLAECSNVHALKLDFFKSELDFWQDPKAGSKRLLLLNPPYGHRIKIKSNLKSYFHRLLKRIETEICPDHFGVIVPAPIVSTCRTHLEKYDCILSFPFDNGGIKVSFLVFSQLKSSHS